MFLDLILGTRVGRHAAFLLAVCAVMIVVASGVFALAGISVQFGAAFGLALGVAIYLLLVALARSVE